MKLATGVNFIKLFQHNLRLQWCNPSQNLRQYADRGINYDEKSFMKLATGDNPQAFSESLMPLLNTLECL